MEFPFLGSIKSFIKLFPKKNKYGSYSYSREPPMLKVHDIIKIIIFGCIMNAFLFNVFLLIFQTLIIVRFSTNLSISTKPKSCNWLHAIIYFFSITPSLMLMILL